MTERTWKFVCNQEGKTFILNGFSEPILCPNNLAHTISVLEERLVSTVKIKEEFLEAGQVPTNGYFRYEGFRVTCAANSVTEYPFFWPFPISPTVIKLHIRPTHINDIVNTYISRNKIIGVITRTTVDGLTVLPVSSTVLQYIKPGFLCKLTNGVNTDDLGQVISVNKTDATITVSSPTTNSFNIGSYIKMTIHNIKNFYLYAEGACVIGNSRIGSSYLPANTEILLVYDNTSNDEKVFNWEVEYMY